MRKFKCIGRNNNFSEKYFIVKLGVSFICFISLSTQKRVKRINSAPLGFMRLTGINPTQ